MNSVRSRVRESSASHMQAMLASVNWEAIQQTVQEIQRRLADAVARNKIDQIKLHRHMLQASFSAKALAKRQPPCREGKADWTVPVSNLLARIEPMATLSITHLSKTTRRKLAMDSLSVASYPNKYGGFVFVGGTASDMPQEADLFAIAEVAQLANLVWLKFDRDGAVIKGLPVFVD